MASTITARTHSDSVGYRTAPGTSRLDERELLDLWDHVGALPPARRADALAAVVSPERPSSELANLSLGQRDRLLLSVLAANFTPSVAGVVDCGGCAAPVEIAIRCADLLDTEPPGEPEPFDYDNWQIRWRLPTAADLLAADQLTNQADTPRFLLRRCVLDVSGPTDHETLDDLPEAVHAKLVETIGAHDPLTDVELDVSCPTCGWHQHVGLDAAALVWHEINWRAGELIRDVDALAHAYGWTEADVLALSPRRRRAYLELADG
jgi:hypothetical protein